MNWNTSDLNTNETRTKVLHSKWSMISEVKGSCQTTQYSFWNTGTTENMYTNNFQMGNDMFFGLKNVQHSCFL